MLADNRLTCPCCGQYILEQERPDALAWVKGLSDNQSEIISALITDYPKAVASERLVSRLYGNDPNGGPMDPVNSISVLVWKIRRKIEPFGWTIPANTAGRSIPAFYRLERLT